MGLSNWYLFNLSYDEDHEAPWLQNPKVYKHNSFLNRKMN